MIVIISPAKRLDFNDSAIRKQSTPLFLKDASRLVAQLRELSAEQLQELMSVSPKIADLNAGRFKAWNRSTTDKKAKQALLAFCGDVYLGLDAGTFEAKDFDFAQKHLRILSGLYGVLKPLDMIQAYRLEMGTRLKNKQGDNLYDFWGSRISEALAAELAEMSRSVLINLASNEYFRSITTDCLDAQIITPVFKEKKNGVYKVISFTAKRARGMMARYIIKNRIKKPELLKQFCDGDYRYQAKLSTEAQWVFGRG
ncbi:MAG: peroxide stress protein YaaA [Gammaproteobacteria bacterium]|nr:peroxide stress protein YaaA [Gammaproteobacteria bacterium]